MMQTHIYKTVAGMDLTAAVHLPDKPAGGPRPAMVFFHGGGWAGGTPQQFAAHAEWLAAHGAVGVLIQYRFIDKTAESVFDCMRDAHSAMRWVRAHADELGIDPHRIGAVGGSAGGHLAAVTAFIDCQEPDEDASVSSRPDVLALFNPVIDTTSLGFGERRFPEGSAEEGSPVHHVQPGAPPTIVLCGRDDTTTPFENVERFQRAMAAAGNTCRLVGYDGQPHGWFNQAFEDTWLREVVPFLGEVGFLPEAGG